MSDTSQILDRRLADICRLCVSSKADHCQTRGANMKRITIRLPDQQLDMIDYMVAQGEFPSASEAIRTAVRELIDERGEKLLRRSEMIAALS
ncbi:hypothetical protein J2755_000608 [Methanohalophilus levihalophilus]|uniref:ribbon-helix-helix domain-containing protein n=1 Tax=Methanohalophilus levihalophilus TaxID=1431282 RepID=UPI001AEB003A|nr:type II toxin-antitoxin system ParD family antitoxin [Methanohalophilus levihalophilus]MBP2029688.1 hypothetical protein [Methanohalophilus levihalophilus]